MIIAQAHLRVTLVPKNMNNEFNAVYLVHIRY